MRAPWPATWRLRIPISARTLALVLEVLRRLGRREIGIRSLQVAGHGARIHIDGELPQVVPRGAPYLVVYPFVKKREWYALPIDDRRRAMAEHAAVGSRFVTITNHTTYSFGIDDQEFMTAFEGEAPAEILHLMMTPRETEASRYTERDTPIFVGTAQELPQILDSLDGASARVESA